MFIETNIAPLIQEYFFTEPVYLPSQIYPKMQLHVPVMCRHFCVLFGRGGTNVMSKLTIQVFDMPLSSQKLWKLCVTFVIKNVAHCLWLPLKTHFNYQLFLPYHLMNDWYNTYKTFVAISKQNIGGHYTLVLISMDFFQSKVFHWSLKYQETLVFRC